MLLLLLLLGPTSTTTFGESMLNDDLPDAAMAATASSASIPRSISVMPCIWRTRSRTEFAAMLGGENPMVGASLVLMMTLSDFSTALRTVTTCPPRSSWSWPPSVMRCCPRKAGGARKTRAGYDTQQKLSCRCPPGVDGPWLALVSSSLLTDHVPPSQYEASHFVCGKKRKFRKKSGTYSRFLDVLLAFFKREVGYASQA